MSGPVVLTAGHCGALGDRFLVAFNVEENSGGDQLVTAGAVIESSNEPDYALIQQETLPAIIPTLLATSLGFESRLSAGRCGERAIKRRARPRA